MSPGSPSQRQATHGPKHLAQGGVEGGGHKDEVDTSLHCHLIHRLIRGQTGLRFPGFTRGELLHMTESLPSPSYEFI